MSFLKKLNWANLKKFISDNITHSKDSNVKMAASIGLGFFFGVSPFWGYHMILAGVAAHFFKLNKIVAIASSNISLPPLIPFVLYGGFVMGNWIFNKPVTVTLKNVTRQPIGESLMEYAVGSLTLGLIAALLGFCFSYLLLKKFRKIQPEQE
jgi:uncharacterized protein (DUF2062 family)